MGMTIAEVVRELKWTLKVHKEILETDAKEIDVDSAWIKHWESVTEALNIAINTMLTYDGLRTDYENRLKADLKAILVELQLEIHELENPYPHDYDNLLLLAQHNAFYDAKSTIEDLVEEKNNALRGENDDKREH